MSGNFISIDGTKLFYAERNSAGPVTIFFFHGNSSSHQTWDHQLNSALLSRYRLVAFDLPAHGMSNAAPAHNLPAIAALMAIAVRRLSENKPFMLAGVSLGTNIIAEMLAHDIHPEAILLAGPCIVGEKHTPDKFMVPGTKIGVGFVDDPDDDDRLAVCRLAINSANAANTALFLKDFAAVKGNFRSQTGQSIAEGNFSDEIALIKKKNVPVLVIFGAADGAIFPGYLDDAGLPLWKNKIIKLKDAGHWVHLDEPELFTQLLTDFGKDIFH